MGAVDWMKLAADRLQDDANELGLNWDIEWRAEPGEPFAFHARTRCLAGKEHQWKVIGGTLQQARDCITLAFASKR